jgi:hypothetical protein
MVKIVHTVTREGVFETNSSSSHSVVVSLTDYRKEYWGSWEEGDKEVDGLRTVATGEYGWGGGNLIFPEEKASYLFTHLMSREGFEKSSFEERLLSIHNALKKRFPNADFRFEDCSEAISLTADGLLKLWKEWYIPDERGDGLDPREPKYKNPFLTADWGYIDHQSWDVAEDVFRDGLVERVICDSAVKILIDNDNH